MIGEHEFPWLFVNMGILKEGKFIAVIINLLGENFVQTIKKKKKKIVEACRYNARF